jgi:hypothetical protein
MKRLFAIGLISLSVVIGGCQKPARVRASRPFELVISLCQCNESGSARLDEIESFTLSTNCASPLFLTVVNGNGTGMGRGEIPSLVLETPKAKALKLRKALLDLDVNAKQKRFCSDGVDVAKVAEVVREIQRNQRPSIVFLIGPIVGHSEVTYDASLKTIPVWWLGPGDASVDAINKGKALITQAGFKLEGVSTDPMLFYAGLGSEIRRALNGDLENLPSKTVVAELKSPKQSSPSIASTSNGSLETKRAGNTNSEPPLTAAVKEKPVVAIAKPVRPADPEGPVLARHGTRPLSNTDLIADTAPKTTTVQKPLIDEPLKTEQFLPMEGATVETIANHYRSRLEENPLPKDFVALLYNEKAGRRALELSLNQAEKRKYVLPGPDCSGNPQQTLTDTLQFQGIEQVLDVRPLGAGTTDVALVTISRRIDADDSAEIYQVRLLGRVAGHQFARSITVSTGQSPVIPLKELLKD